VAYDEIVVAVRRTSLDARPELSVVGKHEGATEPIKATKAILQVEPSLVALGGKYQDWLQVTIRFHGAQLPIPAGIHVEPIHHEKAK
jgi:hypothetical protein